MTSSASTSSATTSSVAVLSVDPTKRKTGGALLGDRIRLNALGSDSVFMRSLATRQAHRALTRNIEQSIAICQAAGFGRQVIGQITHAIRQIGHFRRNDQNAWVG